MGVSGPSTRGVGVGAGVGVAVGAAVGTAVGTGVGVGEAVGMGVGVAVGVGLAVGEAVGAGVGEAVAEAVGVGVVVGAEVAATAAVAVAVALAKAAAEPPPEPSPAPGTVSLSSDAAPLHPTSTVTSRPIPTSSPNATWRLIRRPMRSRSPVGPVRTPTRTSHGLYQGHGARSWGGSAERAPTRSPQSPPASARVASYTMRSRQSPLKSMAAKRSPAAPSMRCATTELPRPVTVAQRARPRPDRLPRTSSPVRIALLAAPSRAAASRGCGRLSPRSGDRARCPTR